MTALLRISVPLTVWLAAFSATYGLHGLVCSPRWAEAGLDLAAGRAALATAAALAVAAQVVVLFALSRPGLTARRGFTRRLSLVLATAALVASVWTAIPAVATSACI